MGPLADPSARKVKILLEMLDAPPPGQDGVLECEHGVVVFEPNHFTADVEAVFQSIER